MPGAAALWKPAQFYWTYFWLLLNSMYRHLSPRAKPKPKSGCAQHRAPPTNLIEMKFQVCLVLWQWSCQPSSECNIWNPLPSLYHWQIFQVEPATQGLMSVLPYSSLSMVLGLTKCNSILNVVVVTTKTLQTESECHQISLIAERRPAWDSVSASLMNFNEFQIFNFLKTGLCRMVQRGVSRLISPSNETSTEQTFRILVAQ